MSYGISCWPSGDHNACRNHIEAAEGEDVDALQGRAGREGWCLGHWDGQAYYVCPEHRDSVWDALPLLSLRPKP